MNNARAEWADFDNDGLLDLIVTGTDGSGASKVVVYLNNGDDTFNALQVAGWSDASFYLNDYNNDGYIDILLAGVDGTTKKTSVFKNSSGSTFEEQSYGLTGLSRSALLWEDLDGDGDLDIVQTGLDAAPVSKAIVYAYDGAAYHEVSAGISPASSGTLSYFDANNDGTPEVMLTASGQTVVYSVSEDLVFSTYGSSLAGSVFNSTTLGDYNEDGFVDFVNTGNLHTDLYKNNTLNGFIHVSTSMEELIAPSADFGDLNNDGLLDIFLTGEDNGGDKYALYYQNTGGSSYSFSKTENSLTPVSSGDVAIGDYDNDGDQDIFQFGHVEPDTLVADLYQSDLAPGTTNAAPSAPSNLIAEMDENTVFLSWDAGSDGLTHANSLTYNLYISENAGGTDLVVSPNADISSGYRKLMRSGNAGFRTEKKIYGVPEGTYYWSVQTLDNSHKGSAFATEESFNICYAFSLGNDTTICTNESVEFSVATVPYLDDVEWFTRLQGSVGTSVTYSHRATKRDTVIARVTKTFGCVVYDTLIVDVYELPSFDLGNDTAVCYGEDLPLSVSDQGIAGLDSVNWYSMDQGELLKDSENLTYRVLERDTLIAEVFNASGCVNYDSLVVDVFTLPAFNIGNDTSVCYQEFLPLSVPGFDSVNWYSTDRGLLVQDSEDLNYRVLERDTLIAEVFNVNGCVNYDSLVVDMLAWPSFSLGNDTAICYREYLELSVSDLGVTGLDSVNWYSTVHGLLVQDNEGLDYQVQEKDTLIAEVFNVNDCVNYDSLIVDVLALPEFELGNDTTICYMQYLPLAVTGFDSVNWYSMDQGELLKDSEELTYQVLERDTLIAEVFNASGCVNYDSLVVGVFALPAFNIGNDISVCYREFLPLSVQGLDSVNWYSTGLSLLSQNSENLDFQVLEKDTVVAEFFNTNGCVSYDSLIVGVLALPSFDLGNDTSICYQEYLPLSVSGFDSVNWFSALDGLLLQNSENLDYEVLKKDTLIAEVFNVSGCVSYDTLIVDVYPLPSFDLGNDTSICYQESILLRVDPSFDEINWYSKAIGSLIKANSWFFNYQVLETDTLIAEVYDVNRCLNYDTIIISMDPLPDFDLDDQFICFGDSVALSIPGTWDEVNWYTFGNQLLQHDSPAYKFKVEESVTLWAEVFNVAGCAEYDTVTVNMLPLPELELGSDRAYCLGDRVSFDVGDIGQSYDWTNASGETVSTQHAWSFSANATDSLFLTVISVDNCRYSDSLKITVNPLPDFEITGTDEICEFDTTALSISFAGYKGISWHTRSLDSIYMEGLEFHFSPAMSTWLYAGLTDHNACIFTDSIFVTVNKRPPALAGEDALICYGEETILGGDYSGTSGLTFAWSAAASLSASDVANPTASPVVPTTYILEVMDARGCNSFDTVYVEVNPEIVVDAGEDVSVCLGDSVQLGGNPSASGSMFGYTYSWMPSAGLSAGDVPNPRTAPSATQQYVLQVTSGDCIVKYDTVVAVVNYAPEITVSPQQSVGPDESVQLFASGGVAYSWMPEELLDDPASSNPIATPLETTLFEVLVTDENGCDSAGTVSVLVQNVIFIPNLFTPNGDGNNDYFKLFGSGIARVRFAVYDLNGNEIFLATTLEKAQQIGWDGTSGGRPLPNGTYIWTLKGEFHNRAELNFGGRNKGTIQLLR